MNTIEEQLWNYIDGNCTTEEKAEIEARLAVNLQYHTVYQELLAVHNELNKLDFEEPSMSFTRNVMDKVSVELKPVALKTKVDNRIIYSITAFFVLSIAGIFGYVIANSDTTFNLPLPKMNLQFDESKIINPTSIKIFLMIDVVLILLYLDSFLRKRKDLTQKKGV
ncbi:hypothetical protein FA048_02910 [Pedobacter polaris]|uniref:Zf-HC2 domain-containing protein n=1 Tax=Pedobacter polaris TaxID=2571273 RepID=A0A4U1CUW1_9SPHI|nr:hypothetical protein [Pedobacter polaris]TKC12583.1 hypothetical protein FA048_02910 [Pedobacter polaris]